MQASFFSDSPVVYVELSKKETPTENDCKEVVGSRYRESAGSVLLLTTLASLVVSVVMRVSNRHVSILGLAHWRANKSVITYLKYTENAAVHLKAQKFYSICSCRREL